MKILVFLTSFAVCLVNGKRLHKRKYHHERHYDHEKRSLTNVNYKMAQANTVTDAHNTLRQYWGFPDLNPDFVLGHSARKCAEYLASLQADIAGHPCSNPDNQGENLFLGTIDWNKLKENTDAARDKLIMNTAMKAWEREKGHTEYCTTDQCLANLVTGSNIPLIGHYVQVLWKDMTKVGCAWAKKDQEKYYVVCRYNEIPDLRSSKALLANFPNYRLTGCKDYVIESCNSMKMFEFMKITACPNWNGCMETCGHC